mmetsp:Transcript_18036/g.68392  ORF Transcript_18036/g.68392 Transcript_18036/m.68392 type:complete len:313 (-) Transcript_18036:741-1679(-)
MEAFVWPNCSISTSSMNTSSSSPVSVAGSGAPSAAAMRSTWSGDKDSGKTILNTMKRLPFCSGSPLMGMPSPSIRISDWSLITLPGATVYVKTRSSRCVIVSVKPHNACDSEIFFTIKRSAPFRLNTSCSRCSTTKTMSPGATSGSSLPSPRMTILSPDFMPFSTYTSSTLRSLVSFLPLQSGQRSPSRICTPVPLQSGHTVRTCWIMGPICRTRTTTFRPLQVPQVLTTPPLRTPEPPQVPHFRSRVIAKRDVFPLYRSSSPTRSTCFIGATCFGPASRLPPPPKKALKTSSGPPAPPPPPFSTASLPPSS